ncbi:hypothetical protein LCGC14_2278480 [marine sediment metagenome]|uniref:Uncharacterized protein n=1 Tax=marine sediment metagenome TaxID=412755 RepID=A0A0F9DH32_9ZZZZ
MKNKFKVGDWVWGIIYCSTDLQCIYAEIQSIVMDSSGEFYDLTDDDCELTWKSMQKENLFKSDEDMLKEIKAIKEKLGEKLK